VFNPTVAVDDLDPTAPCPRGIDSALGVHIAGMLRTV
jgi:hypothetical protein